VYALVKAGTKSDGWSSAAIALVTLSALLPVLALVPLLRWWRWANNADCAKAEAEVLRIAAKAPFKQYTVAGMHTVAFGSAAIRYSEAVLAAAQRKPAGSLSDERTPLGAPTLPPPTAPVVLLLHGYMSGTAMYMFNVDDLVERGYLVYSADWLGCGASDRPRYWPRTTAQTESFFLDALEEWQEAHGLPSLVLFAHSMGGYLASCYAIRRPLSVRHLVLVSPAAVPAQPAAGPAMPRFQAPQDAPTPRPIPPFLWSIVRRAWSLNVTPGVLLRFLGPCGRCCARRATMGRMSRMVLQRPLEPVLEALSEYFYHNIAGDGSGDYALTHVFAPGAWGHDPVGPRLLAAAQAGVLRRDMPVTLTYGGTHDWMNAGAGMELAEALQALGFRASVHKISPGGHHLYLESPHTFNAVVLRELEATFGRHPAGPAPAPAVPGAGAGVLSEEGVAAPEPGPDDGLEGMVGEEELRAAVAAVPILAPALASPVSVIKAVEVGSGVPRPRVRSR
jgi:pimeloyl-ACP methyl ester carboxylesterase